MAELLKIRNSIDKAINTSTFSFCLQITPKYYLVKS